MMSTPLDPTNAALARWVAPALCLCAFAASLVVAAPPASAQRPLEDERMAPPPPPRSLEETAARFVPDMVEFASVVDVALADGGETRWTFEAIAGACYAVLAHSDTIADLDVWIEFEGETLAQGVQPDAYPVARWCADRSGRIEARLVAFEGAGRARARVYVDPDSAAAVVGPVDELSGRLSLAVSRAAPRWTPEPEQWRGGFAEPRERRFALPTRSDLCYALVGVGEVGVTDLDLVVETAEGARIAEDLATDANPVVAFCTDESEELVVRVFVVAGSGFVAVRTLTARRP